jgi:hypothetical protein
VLTFDEGKPAVVEYTATNPNAFEATVKSVTAINGVNIDGDVHDSAAFLGGPPAFLIKGKQSRDFQLSFNTDPDKGDVENADSGVTKFDIQVVAQFSKDPSDRHCDDNFLCTYTATTLELTVKDVTGGGAPEPATWVTMMLGFAGLGVVGYRASSKRAALAA